MPISHEFDYKKVETLDEAVNLLAQYGDKAKIIAGGTDLTVQIKENIVAPDILIDAKGLAELNKIEFSNNILKIGAGVTFSEIEESEIIKEKFYILWEAAGTVASVGVRSRATVAGNICSAVPSLDSAPALLVFDAKINVQNSKGKRTISIQDWFTGPKRTALENDEMLTSITIELPKEKTASCYKKLGRYKGEDLAQAGVGVLVSESKKYKVSFCAVGPVPVRASKIENYLNGKNLTDDVILEAQKLVEQEISPITDIRASKEYRTEMCKVMLERALQDATAVLSGGKMKYTAII
jgi:CO/xanthine dehydrogenase FAD-binding subunit